MNATHTIRAIDGVIDEAALDLPLAVIGEKTKTIKCTSVVRSDASSVYQYARICSAGIMETLNYEPVDMLTDSVNTDDIKQFRANPYGIDKAFRDVYDATDSVAFLDTRRKGSISKLRSFFESISGYQPGKQVQPQMKPVDDEQLPLTVSGRVPQARTTSTMFPEAQFPNE